MAKKKGVTVISGTVDEITKKLKKATDKLHTKIDPNERDYEVKEATIKDMLCNYSITITGDVNHGDRNKITGSGVVDKICLRQWPGSMCILLVWMMLLKQRAFKLH